MNRRVREAIGSAVLLSIVAVLGSSRGVLAAGSEQESCIVRVVAQWPGLKPSDGLGVLLVNGQYALTARHVVTSDAGKISETITVMVFDQQGRSTPYRAVAEAGSVKGKWTDAILLQLSQTAFDAEESCFPLLRRREFDLQDLYGRDVLVRGRTEKEAPGVDKYKEYFIRTRDANCTDAPTCGCEADECVGLGPDVPVWGGSGAPITFRVGKRDYLVGIHRGIGQGGIGVAVWEESIGSETAFRVITDYGVRKRLEDRIWGPAPRRRFWRWMAVAAIAVGPAAFRSYERSDDLRNINALIDDAPPRPGANALQEEILRYNSTIAELESEVRRRDNLMSRRDQEWAWTEAVALGLAGFLGNRFCVPAYWGGCEVLGDAKQAERRRREEGPSGAKSARVAKSRKNGKASLRPWVTTTNGGTLAGVRITW